MQNMGTNIRLLRKQKEITQRELALRVNKDPSYICKIENGITKGNFDTIHDIATALGVSVIELLKHS